jgi:hypothetical protein
VRVTINLFSAPYQIGFAQNGIFGRVSGDFCRNFRGFHLVFGKLNPEQHKKLRIPCVKHEKHGSKTAV